MRAPLSSGRPDTPARPWSRVFAPLGVETYAHIRPDSPRLARRRVGVRGPRRRRGRHAVGARRHERAARGAAADARLRAVGRHAKRREARGTRAARRARPTSVLRTSPSQQMGAARRPRAPRPRRAFAISRLSAPAHNCEYPFLKAPWTTEQAIDANLVGDTLSPSRVRASSPAPTAKPQTRRWTTAANRSWARSVLTPPCRTARRYRSRTSQWPAAALSPPGARPGRGGARLRFGRRCAPAARRPRRCSATGFAQ